MNTDELPVAVIGAGPVGLAAAAHLVTRGVEPIVLEGGATVAASVLKWGHVRVFSPWEHDVDSAAAALLESSGWVRPPDGDYPTGRELFDQYLAPLAALPQIRPHLRLNSRVTAIGRLGFDRTKTAGREQAPFVLRVRSSGVESEMVVRAVIDASGTYESPNPIGATGLPAIGEASVADHVFYGIPDVLGTQRRRYAGRRVLVVGSGHSALNVLLDLAALTRQEPLTTIAWAIRRPDLEGVFGGGSKDQLPERGRLGSRMRALVEDGSLTIARSFSISRLDVTAEGIVARAGDRALAPVDEIVAATGFRPDVAMLRELRLSLDPILESPAVLAPLIDPNVHSCGTVPPHGANALRHPEQDFYIVGMKSYGRAPTFLMLTGYEQVRSVVCALTGDDEGAREVRLVLPETGVCRSDSLVDLGSACCGSSADSPSDGGACEAPQPLLQIGTPRVAKGCC